MFHSGTAFNFSYRGNRSGFTLIEVMVSIAIISVIFISLFRMQASSADLARACEFSVMAPILAGNLIAEAEHDSGIPSLDNEKEREILISDVFFKSPDLPEGISRWHMKKIIVQIRDKKRTYMVTTWRWAR